MTYFDEQEIRKTIAILKPNNQLFEVRVIYNTKQNFSGYFRDVDTLMQNLKSLNLKGSNVYLSLNSLVDSCYDRTQRDHFEKYANTSTSDNDIEGYDWLFVDLDTERTKGTSSTDDELQAAKDVGNRIFFSLRNMGFEEPVRAISGNGVHLLYKLNLNSNDETKALIKKCLTVLDALFSTEKVKIDVVNINPSRVCKLYGTLAQKGSNTKSRPHRMSYIIGDQDRYKDIKPTDIAYLKKLAAVIPDEPPQPQKYNSYNPGRFDIEEWLNKYQIGYKVESCQTGTKYVLDHCPFDDNHKGKDAVIFKSSNGAIAFHCFHNSCSDKTWKDVRIKYEPNAYEKKWQDDQKRMYYSFNRNRKPPGPKQIEKKEDEPVFLTANMILGRRQPDEEFIRTGITDIDKRMRGLKKGHVSVWSGLRASGKSSVLSQIGLNAADAGNNVAFYSGELTESNFLKWMMLQAAGKGYVKPSQYEGYYYTPDQTAKVIANWMGERIWLYNNTYGNNFTAVMAEFEKLIEEKKLDLLILDNLMAFDISDLGQNKWDAQTQFVWSLTQMAKKHQVHLGFVAHPKKSMGFLRFDDISGTADLGNAVDDAFIVHRNNNDFKRLSQQMFGWHDDNEIYKGTNVIEIVKDRDGGTQDVFIPLYYEVESKRLKNYVAENVIYGWNEEKKEIEVDLDGFEEMSDGESNPFG